MKERYVIVPIGYVRSSVRDKGEAPRQGRDEEFEAVLEILEEYAAAIEGIRGWDVLQVICWMHLASRDILQVHPQGDPTRPLTGVFGTRSPARPNPLAGYTVELVNLEGLKLTVRGIDAVDGTPVVDIKPHIRRLDD